MKLKTSGVLEYREPNAGGYEVASTWWVESRSLRGCAARIIGRDGRLLVELSDEGRLTIHEFYRWNGMSGLGKVDDTKNTHEASLAHDAGCQLTRMGHLFPWRRWATIVDRLFEALLKFNGMSWARRRFLRLCLFLRGQKAYAGPQPEQDDKIHRAQ